MLFFFNKTYFIDVYTLLLTLYYVTYNLPKLKAKKEILTRLLRLSHPPMCLSLKNTCGTVFFPVSSITFCLASLFLSNFTSIYWSPSWSKYPFARIQNGHPRIENTTILPFIFILLVPVWNFFFQKCYSISCHHYLKSLDNQKVWCVSY